MKHKIIISIISIFLIVLTLFLYPIAKLFVSDNSVSKSLFSETYYIKMSSNQSEESLVSKYLEDKGYIENKDKRMGAELIFEKDNKEKRVYNNNFKTIIIDGKLNLEKFF